jgi:hypothetical protein
VIVPTFNEARQPPGADAALMVYPEISMPVVDDNSPDSTGDLADKLARTYSGRIEGVASHGEPRARRSHVDGIRSALNRPWTSSVRWIRICRTIRASCAASLRRANTRTSCDRLALHSRRSDRELAAAAASC